MTDRKRRVLEQWQKYETKVLPRNCSDEQRQETRRAFYAGAACIVESLCESVSDGPEATDDDAQILIDFHIEIDEFMAAMLTGKA